MSESENSNETSSRSRTSGRAANSAGDDGPTAPSSPGGWDNMVSHISSHKIDFILAITRALTVLCTLSYLIGFPGPSQNRFKQALLLNAATSSLRLHQRIPPPQLNQINRSYFSNLIKEDSFHYLIFPLMFFIGQPITLALLPCALYAVFNLAVYAITILEKLGNQEPIRIQLANYIAKYQQSLLHTIALSEITLMPVVSIGVFTKAVSILVPMVYYRFLLLRYNSTRNAHFKLLISQIRNTVTTFASRYMHR